MNICFLAHAGSIHTLHWLRYFRDREHQVSVVTLTPADHEPGISIHYIPQKRESSIERTNWHYLTSIPQIRRIVRELRPDILNAHFLSSYGVIGALVRPRLCPLVISLHGSDILLIPSRSPLHKQAAAFALRRADLITSVAEHMTGAVRQFVDEGKPVLTLQYGVNTSVFHPPDMGAAREPICLSNRRLVPLANIDAILSAARILVDEESPLRFILAGSGHQRQDFEKSAVDLIGSGKVTFIGEIDQIAMADRLSNAAIYVSMTSSDGTSLSLLEAMACGAFPVVSDIPANREWIRHGSNGFLTPLDSSERLAAYLREAWERPDLRESAAALNWHLVREKADYRTNMSRIEQAYESLVASSR